MPDYITFTVQLRLNKIMEMIFMLELLIVVLLVYVSYKLKQQEKLIREQNNLIESLQEMQGHCKHHVKRLEKLLRDVEEEIIIN